MSGKNLTMTIALAVILFSSIISTSSAQSPIISSNNISVELRLAPANIEAGEGTYSFGYVNIVNQNGILMKPTQDVTIKLKSDDPSIVTVPDTVTILTDAQYSVFDVHVGDATGKTTISATLNDRTVFHDFIVGQSNTELPDDVELVILLPTKNMHVESHMPFSVFLQTPDEKVIQAPYDIEILLDFEESLVGINEETLIIKKGAFYAWTILTTNEKVGTAFIRAVQEDLNLRSAKDLGITSSLATGLVVNVFPQIVAKEIDRNIDIIVSLIDAEGNPTLAQEDIPLEFFSDNTYVGNRIDDFMDESATNGVIKKGDFSYHFRQKLSLNNLGSEIIVGASTEGLGIGSDCFLTREAYTSDNPIVGNKTMHVFTLDKIPSNTNTVSIYQIGALLDVETDVDIDDEERNRCVDLDFFDSDPLAEDVTGTSTTGTTIITSDSTEVEFHPVLSNENLVSEGDLDKVNLISSDNLLLQVKEVGIINQGTSYGTAILESGKETGVVTLSATIKGMGSDTSPTEIVNTIKHDATLIFSPISYDTILFDKEGGFDLFVISLDGKGRPALVEDTAKYLLTPVNELVEIEKDNTFAQAKFRSESFGSSDDEELTILAVPVGISADEGLTAETMFKKRPSSIVKVILPYAQIDSESRVPFKGIAQLVDISDNPLKASADIRVKIVSSNTELVEVPRFVTINEGTSFGTFDIIPTEDIGFSIISANANGVIGTEEEIEVRSFLAKLRISTGAVEEPLVPGESIELKLYVDDQYLNSVAGASLQITPIENTIVSPLNILTAEDGSTTVNLTPPRDSDTASFEVFATAEGYLEQGKLIEFSVVTDGTEGGLGLDLGIPDWVIYAAVAGILGVGAILFIVLKKPKQAVEEEEEELYEDEDI